MALAVQRLGAKFAAPRGEIIAQLESAWHSITGNDVTRQARVTAALARELQHSVSQDRRRAGPLSEEALALARDSGDDETLASCLLARHDALWGPGTGAVRSALGQEIAAVGNRLGDTDRLAEGLLLEANGLLEVRVAGVSPGAGSLVRVSRSTQRAPRPVPGSDPASGTGTPGRGCGPR